MLLGPHEDPLFLEDILAVNGDRGVVERYFFNDIATVMLPMLL